MKKILILTSILSLFFSCKENNIGYYPSKDYFEKNSSSLIKVSDKIKTIDELENILIENDVLGKVSYINKKEEYKVALFVNSNGLIKERNVVSVTKDSIETEEGKYHISQIKNVLEKHFLNNGKSPYYSSSPESAVVKIKPKKLDAFYQIIEKLIESTEKLRVTDSKVNTLTIYYDLSKSYNNSTKPPKPSK